MVILNSFTFVIKSQEIEKMDNDTVGVILVPDSVSWQEIMPPDSMFSLDSPFSSISPIFKPDPNKAVLFSAIFPGLGQIYNRKYWKLPIVYGGFMGFSYAIMWNNKNLQDYSDAYRDLTYDLIHSNIDEPDNWHQSWQDFISVGVAPSNRYNENFRQLLKRQRDFYRRNRDLSIILTVGFYLICIADSYVDAQLFDFDISQDLSLRIEPVLMPKTSYNPRLYGFNFNLKF